MLTQTAFDQLHFHFLSPDKVSQPPSRAGSAGKPLLPLVDNVCCPLFSQQPVLRAVGSCLWRDLKCYINRRVPWPYGRSSLTQEAKVSQRCAVKKPRFVEDR